MFTRRKFLQTGAAGVSFVSLSAVAPRALLQAAEESRAADKNDHILLVVELNGGNDGLNTLVPYEDPLYHKYRPTLALPKDQLHRLSDTLGLHPQLAGLAKMYETGSLAIVQGVGYPNPDRSHFRSMEIWHTGSTATTPSTTGWLGRVLDERADDAGESLTGLALMGGSTLALVAERTVAPVVGQLESLAGNNDVDPKARVVRELSTSSGGGGPVEFMRKQAKAVYRAAEKLKEAQLRYKSSVMYPQTDLGQQLHRAAQVISADVGVRVLYASQGGYDTHADQAGAHAGLLDDLSQSLAAFHEDMKGLGHGPRVATVVFSEFGRRVDENASRGTDHGAASHLFVLGEPVRGGLSGTYPSLEQLGDGDLVFNTDFRSAYATLLEDWLGCRAQPILGQEFSRLELFKSA